VRCHPYAIICKLRNNPYLFILQIHMYTGAQGRNSSAKHLKGYHTIFQIMSAWRAALLSGLDIFMTLLNAVAGPSRHWTPPACATFVIQLSCQHANHVRHRRNAA
jgi:hypothetical protein